MSESRDLAVAEYRPVCGLAIVALLFGLLSPLSILTPFGWVAAFLGLLFGLLSLRRVIKSESLMIGRSLAIAAVLLSLFFGCAGLGQWATMNGLLTRRAIVFGGDWFEALKHGRPQIAHQLTMAPRMRQAPGGDLWKFYKSDPRFEKQLREFVAAPAVRAVLELGENAQVRPCGVRAYGSHQETMEIQPVYAVTYPSDGGKKTFLVSLLLRRDPVSDTGTFTWRISGFDFVTPEDLKKPPE